MSSCRIEACRNFVSGALEEFPPQFYLDERRDAPGQEAYIFVAARNDSEQVLMTIHTSTHLMEESLELPRLRLVLLALQFLIDRGCSLKDGAQRRRSIFDPETMSFGESFDELSVRFG